MELQVSPVGHTVVPAVHDSRQKPYGAVLAPSQTSADVQVGPPATVPEQSPLHSVAPSLGSSTHTEAVLQRLLVVLPVRYSTQPMAPVASEPPASQIPSVALAPVNGRQTPSSVEALSQVA